MTVALAGLWGWISRRREEEILRLELRHLDLIAEVAGAARGLFEAFARGDLAGVEEAYRRVHDAEKRADEVKEEIIRGLSQGLLHPIDREELIRLVLAADDIAAHLKAASRRALLYARVAGAPSPGIAGAMVEIAGIAVEAVARLSEAVRVLKSDPRRAVQLASEVERLEEKADDIRREAEEEIIKWCEEKGRGASCIALYHSLESLETATDKCEDTGDVIRSIAVLYT